MAFTTESVIAECSTLVDAKAIVKVVRETWIAVAKAHGYESEIAKSYERRYDDFIDEMAFKFAKARKE